MKKLLVLALPLLVLSVSASAMTLGSMRTTVVCKEGYKFLVAYTTTNGTGPAIVQILKKGRSIADPPQPIKCRQ